MIIISEIKKTRQIYPPETVYKGEAGEAFTCTRSPPDSLGKQWRTRSDLNVKQADMDHLEFRGAFPAHSVISTSINFSLPLSAPTTPSVSAKHFTKNPVWMHFW